MFELENIKQVVSEIRTHDLTRLNPLDQTYPLEYLYFIIIKIKFSAQISKKTRDFEKKSVSEIWQK